MNDYTKHVVAAYKNIEDKRLNFLVVKFIESLHQYIGDVQLKSQEWEYCWEFFKRIADFTDEKHNEFLLLADVLGVSQLVEMISHPGADGDKSTLVGPAFRANAPFRKNGSCIVSEDTAGNRLHIVGKIVNNQDEPLSGAWIDVWQAATNGLYENEDPAQPFMNLRGRFITDEQGAFSLVGLMPSAYPVPHNGPVGDLLKISKRSILRPAHIHFIAFVENYETLITQVFVNGDKLVDDDPVFVADSHRVEDFVNMEGENRLTVCFTLKPGLSIYPDATVK